MAEDNILLVDIFDNEAGYAPKLEAHRQALLHRAFSVFIYHENKMLLQRRNSSKYHSGGLLTNTCCSHQREGERLESCVALRLQEEIGISAQVSELFSFVYYTKFENGLTEYEYDHIFVGEYNGSLKINPQEIDEVMWVDIDELAEDVKEHPEKYTVWFIAALPGVIRHIKSQK